MRLPPTPGGTRRDAERSAARWLIVGPGAAAVLARRPPAGVVAEHAVGVHEALSALAARPFHRVLVAGGALADRPRAALRILQAGAPAAELALLGPDLPPRALRAAHALGVPTCDDPARLTPEPG